MSTSNRMDDNRARWVADTVTSYEHRLIAYAVRLTGDENRARDVVQDVFMKLWQADRASVDDHLGPWLYRVCRNRALDVMRKETRMTSIDTTHSGATDHASGPILKLHRPPSEDEAELMQKLMTQLEHLPARQQEILRLKFQGELSYKEIAEVMDMTATNVGFLIHTAIKTLRETLTSGSIAGGDTPRIAAG